MSEQHRGATACTLRRLPDYSGVQIVDLQPDASPADFHEAIKLAVAAAHERIGEHLLLSWYDRDRDFEAPQRTTQGDWRRRHPDTPIYQPGQLPLRNPYHA